jgi:hypothetical protein
MHRQHDTLMLHTVPFIGWATIVVATLVLRFATIALLCRMEEKHTLRWSACQLPESTAQQGPYRAPGVDWRVQRFIWSQGPMETGDPVVQRNAYILRFATILLAAGFIVLIAWVRSDGRSEASSDQGERTESSVGIASGMHQGHPLR